jgi:transcriptional regulator GlxA family with amidase domain
LLERPSDIPVLAASIERELLWRLLNGGQGALLRQMGMANSRLTQVRVAIHQIRARFAEALRIEELADAAGMSVTSFHRHFRAITTMTPIQYQKRIRLQAARERLISAGEDVATVGYAVGYDSPSQFSREYKRLFGHPPGRDGGRLRSAAG